MPYRGRLEALEAKLCVLLETRDELDAAIADARRELAAARRARRKVYLDAIVWPALGFLVTAPAALLVALAIQPPPCTGSRVEMTRTDARTVRSAVEMYLAEHPEGPCPNARELIEGRFIGPNTRTADAWDQPFRIECNGIDVHVHSAGPDGQHGTSEDIECAPAP